MHERAITSVFVESWQSAVLSVDNNTRDWTISTSFTINIHDDKWVITIHHLEDDEMRVMHTVRVTRNNSLVHDVVVEGWGFVRRSPFEFSFFEFKGVVDAFPVPQKNNNVNNHLSKSSVTPSCFRNKRCSHNLCGSHNIITSFSSLSINHELLFRFPHICRLSIGIFSCLYGHSWSSFPPIWSSIFNSWWAILATRIRS